MRTMADEDMVALLKEIRDGQREGLEKQNRFLFILVPIFALMCVQVVLMLVG
jgi:hypothetical protein